MRPEPESARWRRMPGMVRGTILRTGYMRDSSSNEWLDYLLGRVIAHREDSADLTHCAGELRFGQFAFPHANNFPPGFSQHAVHFNVPGSVPGDLRRPVSHVGRRNSAVHCAAMPEASINKNCEARIGKNKVGPSKNLGSPAPAGTTDRTEYFCHASFRRAVTIRPYSSHYFGPLLTGKRVCHHLISIRSDISVSTSSSRRLYASTIPFRVLKNSVCFP